VPKPEWLERKKNYLREVKDADAETRLVSAADKLHNVRSILADYRQHGESVWSRFSGKKDGTLWYYRALSNEYRRSPNRVTRELEIAVAELERAVSKKARSSKEFNKKLKKNFATRAMSDVVPAKAVVTSGR
jgi:(p)ppGpp synthase/HD superfamily hydrolase